MADLTRFRLLRSRALMVGLVICAAVGLTGLAAPWISLGRGEDFFLYRLVGLTRGDLVLTTVALAVGLSLLMVVRFWSLGGLVLALGVFDTARLHRNYAVLLLLLPCAGWLLLFHARVFPVTPIIAPDSGTYLTFHVIRTLAYPLFVRLVALVSDDLHLLSVLQVALGAVAIVLLAEAVQRLVRNYWVSLPLGFALLFNWSLLEHGSSLLSDQPFVTCVILHLAATFLALERPSRTRLVALALTLALATAVRPTGIVLAVTLLFVLLGRPVLWRRMAAWVLAPAVTMMVLLAACNAWVFGYFGLSTYSGPPMIIHAALAMRPDTPFRHPELVRAFEEIGRESRKRLQAIPSLNERRDAMVAVTNPILSAGLDVLVEFVRAHPDAAVLGDSYRQEALFRFWDGRSALNDRINTLPPGINPLYPWADRELSDLAAAATRHDPLTRLTFLWTGLVPAWEDPFRLFGRPADVRRYLEGVRVFDPARTNLGFGQPPAPGFAGKGWVGAGLPFDVVEAAMPASRLAAMVALAVAMVVVGQVVVQLWRRKSLSPSLAALAAVVSFVGAYDLGVCWVHVPIPRYAMAALPGALLLLLIPIEAVQSTIRTGGERIRRGQPLITPELGRRLRSALAIIGFNLLVMTVAVIAIELVFGTWWASDRNNGNLPPNILRTSYRFDTTGLYAGGGKILYRRDQFGLRGTYLDPGKIDILTIGGSTTDQRYIGEGETWQDELSRQFAAAGRPKTVVNAGVDGQSSVGHLRTLDYWLPSIPGFKARYILAYVGINDLHLEQKQPYDAMQPGSAVVPAGLKQAIIRDSAIFRLIVTLRGVLNAQEAGLGHGRNWSENGVWKAASPQPDLAAVEGRLRGRVADYGERVRAIIGRVRALGAVPIIVTQRYADYRFDADGKVVGRVDGSGHVQTGLYSEQTVYNARALAVCREEGAICIDLEHEIQFEDGDFYDIMHNTPAGCRRIGAFLFNRLAGVIKD